MGCQAAKPDVFSIEEEFRKINMPMPEAKTFENEFEKEAWMTVNVLRSNPKILINHIKEVKSKSRGSILSFIAFIRMTDSFYR